MNLELLNELICPWGNDQNFQNPKLLTSKLAACLQNNYFKFKRPIVFR